MTKPISNQGIVINGGSFHAGTVAVGDSARAVSHGAEPVAPAAPLRPPAKIRVGQQPVEATPLSRVPSHWDAFLSHASEDKDFVEPLVDALTARGLTIWYDRSNLRIGNSLREAIDLGLVESDFGIVILSSRYFAKSWTRQEVNGLLSREANGDRVVLPIWHGVTRAEVTRFSPILADRIAARSSDSLDAIAEALVRSIRNGVRTG